MAQLCTPWYKKHNWGIWLGLTNPGQPEARPNHMVRTCSRCAWEQRRTVKD